MKMLTLLLEYSLQHKHFLLETQVGMCQFVLFLHYQPTAYKNMILNVIFNAR